MTFTKQTQALVQPTSAPISNGGASRPQAINGAVNVEPDGGTSDGVADSTVSQEESSALEGEVQELDPRPRKRRRIVHGDDLESQYLNRLAREEAQDEVKRQKLHRIKEDGNSAISERESEASEGEDDIKHVSMPKGDDTPLHETVDLDAVQNSDNTVRTVFLGNVSTEAIKSKSARKTLEKHLAGVIEHLPEHQPRHKVESLRFRSTAFVGDAGPKKAAFAKKELMDKTTKSTNAYVVYSTEVAARQSAAKLNGTIVLDRHLRADYLASPARIDHRRCIFVGNLSFVDEETNDTAGDDSIVRRPKAKVPADAEEGLWRAFGKVGKVESVRVVRDKETRIGKGFAYVQFVDENGVEAALLMNERKFPPMLPRKLRVMRAKKTRQKEPTTYTNGGRQGSKLGSSRGALPARKDVKGSAIRSHGGAGWRSATGLRKPESFVFEGSRASNSSKAINASSKRKKRPAVKPTNRSSRRGAAFKAAGGKSNPDSK